MKGWLATHAAAAAILGTALGACVPVTVNVSFPQAKLDDAARQIEDMPAHPAAGSTPGPAPAPASPPAPAPGSTRDVQVTPQIDTRSPAVVAATESRRQRRSVVREWKNRGCIGETNQGFLTARPGEGCTDEVASLIRAENADRKTIYDAFMRDNRIPASDMARVQSAFAKARQERARPNDWIQQDDGRWVRKS
jgi:uncharacterized protein YdbL (DUF1318 family)